MNEDNRIVKTILIIIIIGLIIFLLKINLDKLYTNVKFGETVNLAKNITFSVVKNQVVEDVYPNNYLVGYSYYQLLENQDCILDVQAEIVNDSTTAINVKDLFKKAELIVNKTHYNTTILYEDETRKNFIDGNNYMLGPNQKIVCHFCFGTTMNELKGFSSVLLKIKGKKAKLGYTMTLISQGNSVKSEKELVNIDYRGQEISKNEKVTVPGICEFEIMSAKFTDIVKPTYVSGNYNYFEATTGNLYMDLIVNATNISSKNVTQQELLGYVSMKDENKKYIFMKIVEEKGGKSLSSQINTAKAYPEDLVSYHLIVEVPESVARSTEPIYAFFYIDGQTYKYQIQ